METPRDERHQYEPEQDPDTDPVADEEAAEADVEREEADPGGGPPES